MAEVTPDRRFEIERPQSETDIGVNLDDQQPAILPRWVPILIALILVVLAALAVYTGLRYRNDTIVRIVKPRRVPQSTMQAPPGEPEPGASLVFPGESGDNTPVAHPAVSGNARAVITGSGSAIRSTLRIWARRGMTLNIQPPDAVVYVNDVPVGQASQFSTEAYEFAQPGSYTVKLVAPGYLDRSVIVTADERATAEVARIEGKLQK